MPYSFSSVSSDSSLAFGRPLTELCLIEMSLYLHRRNDKSWSHWWRFSCHCSSPASSLCCVKRCPLRTTPMPRSTRATAWTLYPRVFLNDCSWATCPLTPAWCVRWQRMCEKTWRFPQVSEGKQDDDYLSFCS